MVVCVVQDGRSKMNPRMLKVLTLMGVYAEGVAKDHVGEKEVTAHIFEATTRAVVSEVRWRPAHHALSRICFC